MAPPKFLYGLSLHRAISNQPDDQNRDVEHLDLFRAVAFQDRGCSIAAPLRQHQTELACPREKSNGRIAVFCA